MENRGGSVLGVCFSFSDPSHLLRSFLFIKDVYLTFLECISFLLVSKYIYNLLRICMFPSQIIRRMSLQFIYISFTIYEKDVASLYVHFKSGLYFQFSVKNSKNCRFGKFVGYILTGPKKSFLWNSQLSYPFFVFL